MFRIQWITLASIGLLAGSGCGVAVRQAVHGYESVRYSSRLEVGRRGPLSPEELEWAKTAWKYFQNNTGATGLVNSLDGVTRTSMWSVGDYLAAMNAARDLGLIKDAEFAARFTRVIEFLNRMDLFNRQLPNVAYNVQTGAMVNDANAPGEAGWSALDLGRLLIWLRITSQRNPEFAEYIDKAVLRWSFCSVIDGDGGLYSGYQRDGKTQRKQEGRLGYEDYAALGFQSWGFQTHEAWQSEPSAHTFIDGVPVSYDAHDPRLTGTYAPVVTLPHTLMGIEFNWDGVGNRQGDGEKGLWAGIAQSVYEVQEARYRKEHILTARSDHPLGRSPGFVYDTIFVAGYPWNTITRDGNYVPEESLVSTRAAFGLWALWKTNYTRTLMQTMKFLNDPNRGWYEGRFENTGGPETTLSSTTNAVVLEAVYYVKAGKFFHPTNSSSYYSKVLQSEFAAPATCLPKRP